MSTTPNAEDDERRARINDLLRQLRVEMDALSELAQVAAMRDHRTTVSPVPRQRPVKKKGRPIRAGKKR